MEPTIFPEDSVLKLFNLRNLFSCNTSFKKTELDTKTCKIISLPVNSIVQNYLICFIVINFRK